VKIVHEIILNSITLVVLMATCVAGARAAKKSSEQMGDMDRAIAFAVAEEDYANQIEKRRDVCVGFSTELDVNQKGIIADLKHRKLGIHSYGWCNKEPNGLTIFVGPVSEKSPAIFEIKVELLDTRSASQRGGDLDTVVRRGLYVVKSKTARSLS